MHLVVVILSLVYILAAALFHVAYLYVAIKVNSWDPAIILSSRYRQLAHLRTLSSIGIVALSVLSIALLIKHLIIST